MRNITLSIKNAATAPMSTSIGLLGGFLLPIALDSFSLPVIGAGLLVAVFGLLIGTKKEEPKAETPKDYVEQRIKEGKFRNDDYGNEAVNLKKKK